MIATLEIVDMIDKSEQIGKMILNSDVMEQYNLAKQALDEDPEAQKLIAEFKGTKEQYEDVQRFGRYHPDYSQIMKDIRSIKRELDMNDKVASFKIAERNLQAFLDEVSELVAFSVSKQVKVPKDGAALQDGGCGCGSGSSGCGCQAS
ncbi:YlbF family regulator [Sediminibacillus massiliensis]|uniref:YlbF family regulator n=1 Tax=Sediminibacillus massiliensis TaxID=1926277 RepID=UPI0009888315|nr:YlbF family regulator [Sediminibacillus massiliensis]